MLFLSVLTGMFRWLWMLLLRWLWLMLLEKQLDRLPLKLSGHFHVPRVLRRPFLPAHSP